MRACLAQKNGCLRLCLYVYFVSSGKRFSFFKKFDLVTNTKLFRHDPYSNLTELSLRLIYCLNIMKMAAKLWPLESEQGFKEIRSSDLVFDPI